MDKEQAIAHLQELIERSGQVQSMPRFCEEFTAWREDARTALRRIFQRNPEYLADFDKVEYHLSMVVSGPGGTGTQDHEFQDAYSSGVADARAHLQARVREIETFGLA